MAVNLSPVGGVAGQFFDNNGAPLSGGKIYTYAAGSSTPAATYTSAAGGTAHTNPIVLDSGGRVPGGEIWLTANVSYKFVTKTSADVLIGTYDNVYGISDVTLPIDSANIAYTPAGTGAVTTNVQTKLRESVSGMDFGAVGDGITNDYIALHNAELSNNQLLFTKGTYLVESDITFTKTPIFQNGAVLKIRSGAVVTFTQGIEAGWYTIFDTTDDFVTDLTINTSVLILGCPVKADWFASKVQNVADIKTISDQTNNLTKAFRAAVGNYIVRTPTQYINQYQQGCVELGIGYYRIDKQLAFGKQTAPTMYYMLGGFQFKGQGVGATYLVKTDLTNTDYAIFLAFYTGELTHFEHFTVTHNDPDSATPYTGQSKACIFMQGDSLQINNVWVSGAQTTVVNGDAHTNGVGFQFSSCVDTYFHDLFVEFCVTGMAFHSSIVSGNNLTLYHTLWQALALGNLVYDYGLSQATSSNVNITGVQANSIYNQGLYVLENGSECNFNLSDSLFNGYDSEFALQVGDNFCHMRGSTRLKGSWKGVDIRNFNGKTFDVQAGCYLGDFDQAFVLLGCVIDGNTATTAGSGVFCATGASVFVNLFVNGLSCSDLYGAVVNGSFYAGNINIENVTLSRYTGASDMGPSRQLFVAGDGSTAPQIVLTNWTRNNSDTVALTQFGYADGACKIYIDINNLYNATRSVAGSPTSVQMPTLATFA